MTLRFRRLLPGDRERIVAISAQTWDGHDFLANVFDGWVAGGRGDGDGRDEQIGQVDRVDSDDHEGDDERASGGGDDFGAYFAGIEVDGILAGCGRVLPFDARRAWLEALRIDPAMQGRGLGRAMAHHIFASGRDRGFEELWFSTYFRNVESIHIGEAAGFQKVAAYSSLDLDLEGYEEGAVPDFRAAGLVESPSIPEVDTFFSNDWLFVPPGLGGRASWFPAAATYACGSARLVVASNSKSAPLLEICWVEGDGDDLRICLSRAIVEARRRGNEGLHVMLPPDTSSEAFKQLGFASHEREEDVFLYRAEAARLRLSE